MLKIIGTITLLAAAAGSVEAETFFAFLHKIEGGKITLTKTQLGKGKKGKGKRSKVRRSSLAITLAVADDVIVTAAKYRRKTREFQVGVELGGRLDHSIFKKRVKLLLARIRTSGSMIVEINVILPESDATTVIGVRPKRPPSK